MAEEIVLVEAPKRPQEAELNQIDLEQQRQK